MLAEILGEEAVPTPQCKTNCKYKMATATYKHNLNANFLTESKDRFLVYHSAEVFTERITESDSKMSLHFLD